MFCTKIIPIFWFDFPPFFCLTVRVETDKVYLKEQILLIPRLLFKSPIWIHFLPPFSIPFLPHFPFHSYPHFHTISWNFLPPFFILLLSSFSIPFLSHFPYHSYPHFRRQAYPFYHQPLFLQQCVYVTRPCPQSKDLDNIANNINAYKACGSRCAVSCSQIFTAYSILILKMCTHCQALAMCHMNSY